MSTGRYMHLSLTHTLAEQQWIVRAFEENSIVVITARTSNMARR